jgi:hypothetical protein
MVAVSTGPVTQKLNYSHEAMIDLIIANPMISQGDLARHFGYTQSWVSRIIRSDGFRELIARRKAEMVDPLILQSIEARFEALVATSLDVLEKKLSPENNPSADLALKTAELSARALGYGAKAGVTINNQQNFVVAMPAKAKDSEEWLKQSGSMVPGQATAMVHAPQAVENRGNGNRLPDVIDG